MQARDGEIHGSSFPELDSLPESGIDSGGDEGFTKLYCAAKNNDLGLVKSLLRQGANPNAPSRETYPDGITEGLTALHIAAINNHFNTGKQIRI
jgi:ankyrin repeat protein